MDVRQRELEERGVIVERALRGDGPEAGQPESELMQDWFNLVHEKNALVRLESELMVRYGIYRVYSVFCCKVRFCHPYLQ